MERAHKRETMPMKPSSDPRDHDAVMDGQGDLLPEEASDETDDDRRVLPLMATIEARSDFWSVSLPVRAEHVTVTKEVVVTEEVVVHLEQVPDTVQVRGTIRREEVLTEEDARRRHSLTTQRLDDATRTGWI